MQAELNALMAEVKDIRTIENRVHMSISRYSVTDFATHEDHKKYFKILSEGEERRLQHLQNYLSYRRIGMRGHYVDNEEVL